VRRFVLACFVSGVLLATRSVYAQDEESGGKSRFAEIGHPPPETADDLPEKPPVAIGLSLSHVGRVTWTGLRADIPLSTHWSIVPHAALLHVSPLVDEPAVVNTYVGGGIGLRPSTTSYVELGFVYGPTAFGIGSVGGELTLSKSVGGDPEHDRPAVLEIEAAFGAMRYLWVDGNGPAGPTVTQMFVDLQLELHLGRFAVVPHLMLFKYDKALDEGGDARVGSVGVLARVGSYAPTALYGGQLRYRPIAALEPYLEVAQIRYAVGIGKGTQVVGGARFHLGERAMFAMGFGVLANEVSGPLIDPDDEVHTLPIVRGQIDVAF